MEILRELSQILRTVRRLHLYCGFDGNMDSCITIRTMILEDSTVSIQAGAGVVADSTPEGEYQEQLTKRVRCSKQLISPKKSSILNLYKQTPISN